MASALVVAGEALVDLIVEETGAVTAVPGGGPYNTARAAGRLGCPTTFAGTLSSDVFGRLLTRGLTGSEVALTVPVPLAAATTLAVAELDPHGAASYHFHTAGTSAPALSSQDLTPVLANPPGALHLGTLGLVLEPMATSLEALVAALPADVLLMLDPNCRPSATPDQQAYRDRLHRLLPRTDVLKVSVDDLEILAPGVPPDQAVAALLTRGPRAVLVTDGARGATVVTGQASQLVPAPTVPVVDSVGAGDTFSGAFLTSWLAAARTREQAGQLELLVDSTAWAVAAAALTCTRAGAEPPTRAELEAFLRG